MEVRLASFPLVELSAVLRVHLRHARSDHLVRVAVRVGLGLGLGLGPGPGLGLGLGLGPGPGLGLGVGLDGGECAQPDVQRERGEAQARGPCGGRERMAYAEDLL